MSEENKGDENKGDEKKQLSKEEIRALFDAADKAESDVKAIETKLAEAKKKYSDSLATIATQVGTGPFTRNGREISIQKRGDTYFLKGKSERTSMSID